MHKHPVSRFVPFALLCLLLALPLLTRAQAALPVTRTAEYDIGSKCPVSATLDPTETAVWVLMDSCGGAKYVLQGYQLADGAPIAADADNFASVLAPLSDQWLYSDTKPLAFTPDGAVDIIYNDPDSYSALNLRLTLDGSPPPASDSLLLTNDTIAELIPGYAGYPETTSYNSDHTLAAVADSTVMHIIDLQSGSALFQVDAQSTTDFSRAYFSTDGQFVYLSTLINGEDVTDYSSTLSVYSLPDGKRVKSYEVLTYLNTVSPDNRFVVGYFSNDALMVTDLTTGSTSEPIIYSEPPREPQVCSNSGLPAPTGVDFMTSGQLPVSDLVWLPDSSAFITVNSNQGNGSGGGRICIFDYSRMRVYAVG